MFAINMSQINTDLEANVPLSTATAENRNTLQSQRADRLKGVFKIVFLVAALGIIFINLLTSIRKGDDIAAVSTEALGKIANTAFATAFEEAAKWKNETMKTQ